MKLEYRSTSTPRHSLARTTLPVALSAILAATWACSSDTTDGAMVRGTVTDSDGTQKSLFGGQGTVASAASVRAGTVGNTGELEILAQAEIAADGSYEIVLPPDATHVVLQAMDGSEKVVASALLEASGSLGSVVFATPMDTESSVEAEVYLAMMSRVGTAEIDMIDVRARIDEATAMAVRAAAQAGDAAAEIEALAQAILAAQAAEIRAYAGAGVTITQEALFEAELQAAQALSTALHQGQDAITAYAAFFEALASAAESLGAGAEAGSSAEASASLSFRLVLDGLLESAGAEAQAVAQAALVHAATLEAEASARAVEAILVAGNAASEIQAQAESASATLVAEVSVATTIQAAVEAHADFAATLIGETSVTGSVLGQYLQVDAAGAVGVDAAIDAAWAASASFEASAKATVEAALATGSAVDIGAVTQALVNAWLEFRAAVQSAVDASPDVFGSQPELGATLIIEATGSFRALAE